MYLHTLYIQRKHAQHTHTMDEYIFTNAYMYVYISTYLCV